MRELREIWGSFGDVEVVEVVLPQGTAHNIPYPKPHHPPFNINYPPSQPHPNPSSSLKPHHLPYPKPHKYPN